MKEGSLVKLCEVSREVRSLESYISDAERGGETHLHKTMGARKGKMGEREGGEAAQRSSSSLASSFVDSPSMHSRLKGTKLSRSVD